MTVLVEKPDQDAALRVLEPGGRVVVEELCGDPHRVSPGRLLQRAVAGGLVFERRSGSPPGHLARFTRPAVAS